jgi:hypothetical protein
MGSDDVMDIILDEIKDHPTVSNLHGVDLNKALIKPIKQEYKNAMDRSKSFILWTVLQENEHGSGYTIFYDEEDDSFGLGMKDDKQGLLYLGNYGSFLETLKGM